jgi:indolepyruvate ferredoxin oxidoreductase
MKQEAFLWGRRAAHDLKTVEALTARNQGGTAASQHKLSNSVEALVATREQFLTEYQNAGYAARYAALVNSVSDWESKRFPGKTHIAEAVARYYFKLMAYKDEYEVARLQSAPKFMEELKQQFEGDFRISFNLAPPGIAQKDRRSGELKKREFGSWMLPVLRVLARLRFLRGTPLDPFGHTAERRTERDLIQKYEQAVALILEKTTPSHYETAVRLASVPELIRGYGHVKQASLQQAEAAWSDAAQQLQQPAVIELHRAA